MQQPNFPKSSSVCLFETGTELKHHQRRRFHWKLPPLNFSDWRLLFSPPWRRSWTHFLFLPGFHINPVRIAVWSTFELLMKCLYASVDVLFMTSHYEDGTDGAPSWKSQNRWQSGGTDPTRIWRKIETSCRTYELLAPFKSGSKSIKIYRRCWDALQEHLQQSYLLQEERPSL